MAKLLSFVVNQERGGTTVNVFINKEGAELMRVKLNIGIYLLQNGGEMS